MNRFLVNLRTVHVAIGVFACFVLLYFLHLPEGAPRIIGAGCIVAAWLVLLFFARRAYNRQK